jgi:secreted PhoX family phosphatase
MSEFQRYDDGENVGVNPSTAPSMQDIIDARLTRRGFVGGLAAFAASTALTPPAAAQGARPRAASTLTFSEVAHGYDERDHVAPGYTAKVLIRWGDPIIAGAPAFDIARQTRESQEKQFGYNNDFMAFMPLPRGSRSSTSGLLFVNHEYTNQNLMFAGISARADVSTLTREQCEVDIAAHGLAVVEVRKRRAGWEVVADSAYNRRLTLWSTPFRLSGPAAGHARLKTDADPSGTRVLGTINNCAGGVTPWGTCLSGEENFNGYFHGDASRTPEAANHRRYGVQTFRGTPWGRFFERWDVEKNPNEPNRFGWVVEVDPYDPRAVPVKRTALGRLKHEGATCIVSRDGRVALYMGDDERFEYVYRFVTAGRFNPTNMGANRDLLDTGTLSVAKFADDGTLKWLPLVHGQGPLTAANGFASQADVLIEARRAADALGATPMDRPEDVEPNPVSGRVYIVCTYNERRAAADAPNPRERINGPNPRVRNLTGHIVELIAPGGAGSQGDHTAETYRWEIFLKGGNPATADSGAQYGAGVPSANGWLAAPDNVAFDPKGRIWITTDGMPTQVQPAVADGLFAADTTGPGRGVTKHFYSVPRGAEMCGPTFTPDGKTLFVAVQHPGEETDSTFEQPSTRWPDFNAALPPRPAVVVITKNDGGDIGS